MHMYPIAFPGRDGTHRGGQSSPNGPGVAGSWRTGSAGGPPFRFRRQRRTATAPATAAPMAIAATIQVGMPKIPSAGGSASIRNPSKIQSSASWYRGQFDSGTVNVNMYNRSHTADATRVASRAVTIARTAGLGDSEGPMRAALALTAPKGKSTCPVHPGGTETTKCSVAFVRSFTWAGQYRIVTVAFAAFSTASHASMRNELFPRARFTGKDHAVPTRSASAPPTHTDPGCSSSTQPARTYGRSAVSRGDVTTIAGGVVSVVKVTVSSRDWRSRSRPVTRAVWSPSARSFAPQFRSRLKHTSSSHVTFGR